MRGGLRPPAGRPAAVLRKIQVPTSLSGITRNMCAKFGDDRIKTVAENAVQTNTHTNKQTNKQTDEMPTGLDTETSLRSVNNKNIKAYNVRSILHTTICHFR